MKYKCGDWIIWQYGFDKYTWCVIATADNHYNLWKPSWLVSSAHWTHISQVDNCSTFICHSKKRWWWELTLIFKQFISPYGVPK